MMWPRELKHAPGLCWLSTPCRHAQVVNQGKDDLSHNPLCKYVLCAKHPSVLSKFLKIKIGYTTFSKFVARIT